MTRRALIALLSSMVSVVGVVVVTVTLATGGAPAPAATPVPGEPPAVRGGISVAIAVTTQAEGEVPRNTAGYTLRLVAENNAPMPTAEPKYDLHVPGPGTATFPAITFDALGVYHYHLSMLSVSDASASYNTAEYDLSITVLRDETSDEWYTMMSIRNAASHQKTDVPLFIITYPEPTATPTPTSTTPPAPGTQPTTVSVTVRKVWNDGDNAANLRPNSLHVTLSNGTTVTLNEANGWSATISDLPAQENGQRITYTWQESEVPAYIQTGYTVNGSETTITNTLWSGITDPDDPRRNRSLVEITDYDTPLNIGVEINHVGDTFD